jgi:hypothetical protein
VLYRLQALRALDLAGMRGAQAVPPGMRQLLAQLQPRVAVKWDLSTLLAAVATSIDEVPGLAHVSGSARG